MLVGYQGMKGSNSENAAKILSKELNLSDIKLVPLISSECVVNELCLNNIDYGVMAIKNTIGGIVSETEIAIRDKNIFNIGEVEIKIHHCLFKKIGVHNSNIKNIASHIQALKQSKENIMKLYPNCNLIEVEDTSIAAKYLSEGSLSEDTAILCKKDAGYMYNLDLIQENMEDNPNNYTTFGIYELIK